MGVTREICDKIVATTYDDLPRPVIAAARQLFLDGLAVAVAGADEEAIRLLAQHYRGYDACPEATALGLGFRTAAPCAAALNGAAMHVLDFEPMWSPATHALSTTLPSVLALAEKHKSNGREMLTALVKGIEIQGWIREAGHAEVLTGEIFHPPGVVGPIGSAVAAGHLLDLDATALSYAIGMAASRAGSLFANAGTMTKCTHCGYAAQAGLESAMLAAQGFNANADVIDAPNGYAAAFLGRAFDPRKLLGFGASFRIVEPGFALKMFPSQFGTHFAITAGLDLFRNLPGDHQIQSIRLTTPEMPYVDRPFPDNGLAGKFSFQYTFCRALADGRVTIDTFTDRQVQDPIILDLLSKVELTMNPAIPARFEAMHVEAHVELADGAVLSARCEAPRGAWGLPPISHDEHLDKVRDCLSRRLSGTMVDRCVALAADIDQLSGAEVGELLAIAGRLH
ncbi:MAG TPA: MmgE/PrpD family protein [Caulobacteraceae bacterium]|nr:MmgE/PrpD family protein [Caulobacteraceae bacterium]